MSSSYLKLANVPEDLSPGDAIDCYLNGKSLECEFVRYGVTRRFVYARIYGLREAGAGVLTAQTSMFEPMAFEEKFVVNDAPGRSWHRTAGISVEVG